MSLFSGITFQILIFVCLISFDLYAIKLSKSSVQNRNALSITSLALRGHWSKCSFFVKPRDIPLKVFRGDRLMLT